MDEVATRSATPPATTAADDALKQKTCDVGAANADAPQSPETDGFHLLIDALKLNGIDTIFGLPGIPITDLTRKLQAAGVRVISFRHEQNAGYAASIAGFMTQKPGICLTVSAPGFLNGLTALANATTNCFPMILISGSSEREVVDLQQGDYEEMDQLAIAKPLAKAAFRVLHAEDIGVGVARAIRAAVSGRPGGVYLDLPAKLFPQTVDADAGKGSLIEVVDPAPRQIPGQDAVRRALDLLKGAKRPLIILGKGAAYAQADADIRALVEKTGIPYLPMSMAKGLLPDTHEQSAAAARSYVLPEADVVMLIGARLNWLLSHGKGKTWGGKTGKAWGGQKFVQVDISPQEADSNVRIDAPVVGDIGSCVSALLAGMGPNWQKPPADWLGAIAERLEGKFGFEDDQMAVRILEKLKGKLAAGVEPVAAGGTVEGLRRIKDEGELAAIAEASKIADEVWLWSAERGLAGRTEREVAHAAEARIRELGGNPSFPAIVGAGPNGALPHAEPGEREIGKGELVVFDMGAQVDGYCSDGTRTYATGDPGERGREIYDITLRAQLASLEAVKAGAKAPEVDGVARKIIDDAGYGENFGHGLGHGVGLEVHESPHISPKADDTLAANEVVTVEPGIYLPGELGVLIEDFVVVTEDGYRNLSTLPKELTVVD